MSSARSPAYQRLKGMLAADRCVILDGGMATELQRHRSTPDTAGLDRQLWGTWALYRAPHSVLEVHSSYVGSGCDVISTNTWSILSAPEAEQRLGGPTPERAHWMEIARLGIRLPRRAIADAGKQGECAVAFAISGEINSPMRQEATCSDARRGGSSRSASMPFSSTACPSTTFRG